MRCNHCDNAPCVEICPVTALYRRDDGIVDFNNNRCIGCKACMQACPYDALYIDPESNTAAKCNYCAHRVDVGLEPACVNVCPTQAIISGDLDDPNSKISQHKRDFEVVARKSEKGTLPALFYIEGEPESLDPSLAETTGESMWGTQVAGVGHFAAGHGNHALDRLGSLLNLGDNTAMIKKVTHSPLAHSRQAVGDASRGDELLNAVRPDPKRAYDAPQKGVLWGWQVSSYLWTKSISAGTCLLPLVAETIGLAVVPSWIKISGLTIALIFFGITGLLLMWDLDQPKRFLYVLLRPQWRSWLVKGAYIITAFSALLVLQLGLAWFNVTGPIELAVRMPLIVFAVLTAIYTAFLFGQAKGRDFWQSRWLPLHMLTHSLTAGAAAFAVFAPAVTEPSWHWLIRWTLVLAVALHLVGDAFELFGAHSSGDSKRTAQDISTGKYKNLFWIGAVLVGSIVPALVAAMLPTAMLPVAGILALVGVFIGQHIWVRAPQQITLS